MKKQVTKQDFSKALKTLGVSAQELASEGAKLNLREGDKVRLNVAAIKSHPDWHKKTATYREWVEAHNAGVFTVEYDPKFGANPSLVCLAEDNMKWLWFDGFLSRVE